MEVEFKIASLEDVEGIIRLCNVCFDENTSLEQAQEIFKKTQEDPNQIYLIGIHENEVVAHTKITVIPTIYEDMGTFAILNHVCVKPSLRRGHIGTKLLDESFKIAKEHQCKCVELWSKNFRQAAHGLYKKYGFEIMDAKFFAKTVVEKNESK